MKFGDIIKAMGTFGEGGPAAGTASGAGPQFVPPNGVVGGFVKPALGTAESVRRARARADEISTRTERTLQNPVAQVFPGIPSERPAPQWLKTAAGLAGIVPRPSAAAGAVGLPGGDLSRTGGAGVGRLLGVPQDRGLGWQSLGPYADRDRIERPPLVSGLATDFKGPGFAGGAGVPFLGSGGGDSFRTYSLPRFTVGQFDSPVLSGLGNLVRGYLGLGRHLEELIAGWRRPIEGFLKQAARRAWEFYPRDSEGRPIPPWNLRLYFLAWAAYRLDDYEDMARFLNAIGADDSPDNVLFVRDLLAPAFDPKRPDRRTAWWLLDPDEARRALRKRLTSLRSDGGVGRRDGEVSYLEDPEDGENPNDPYFYVVKRAPRTVSAEKAFFARELPALLLQELAQVLPERQYEVVVLAMQGLKYERIAREMGITEGAVKAHMHKVRNNPLVAEVLLPQPALRPDGTINCGRTHRG